MNYTVGVVHNENVSAQFAISLATLMHDLPGGLLAVFSGSRVDHGRNIAVRNFLLNDQADWLLFVDSDMVFQPDDVESLFATAEAKKALVVAGLYFDIGGEPTARIWAGEKHRLLESEEIYGEPIKIDASGAGFLLVHRQVLEHIGKQHENSPRPWFAFTERGNQAIGEDMEFGYRVREAGYQMWLDTGCRVGHRKGATL